MPIDYSFYPPYWKQFSLYIRKERAGDRCEECGIQNGVENERGSIVVLTVAHMDWENGPCDCKQRTGMKCARPDHVLALCQADHLKRDIPKHIARRQRTLANQKDAERPLLPQIGENECLQT